MDRESGNLYDGIPADLGEELFSSLLEGDNVKIERIVSRGHRSPPSGWYDQKDHEWVVVLKGEGKVAFETGQVVHLRPGDYLSIPAHTKHKVLWTAPDRETVWLAVHYGASQP